MQQYMQFIHAIFVGMTMECYSKEFGHQHCSICCYKQRCIHLQQVDNIRNPQTSSMLRHKQSMQSLQQDKWLVNIIVDRQLQVCSVTKYRQCSKQFHIESYYIQLLPQDSNRIDLMDIDLLRMVKYKLQVHFVGMFLEFWLSQSHLLCNIYWRKVKSILCLLKDSIIHLMQW